MKNGESCIADEDARIFAQYTCVMDQSEQAEKYIGIVTAEALAILVSLLFLITLKRLNTGGEIDFASWDIATVTAGDYAIEWKIAEGAYNKWDEARPQDKPEGFLFKEAVRKEFESFLNDKLKEKHD